MRGNICNTAGRTPASVPGSACPAHAASPAEHLSAAQGLPGWTLCVFGFREDSPLTNMDVPPFLAVEGCSLAQ
ncbi:unnamed protein product [Caretta caretta]